MASEQSSREVLKRPLVAALTPKMSDAAIRFAFRICITVCCLLVRSLTYCRCGCQGVRGVPLGMSRIRLAAISPDGKYVLNVQNDNGMQSLWLRNVPTGSDTRIVPAGASPYRSLE